MGMARRTIPLEIGLDGIMVDARPRGEQIDQPGLFFLIRQRRLRIIDPQLGERPMDIDEPFADGDAIERAHEALANRVPADAPVGSAPFGHQTALVDRNDSPIANGTLDAMCNVCGILFTR